MLRVFRRMTIPDSRGKKLADTANALFGKPLVKEVIVVDTYVIDTALANAATKNVVAALQNPLVEECRIGTPKAPKRFSYATHLSYRPGVTDNVGRTVQETVEDLSGKKFKAGEAAYASRILFVDGAITERHAHTLANALHNPLIEQAAVLSARAYRAHGGFIVKPPRVTLPKTHGADMVSMEIPDEELAKLGKLGIKNTDGSRRGPLALSLTQLKAIREYFRREKRNPTDIELESLAQTWSEHCKHTIFADPLDDIEEGMYRRYIQGATKRIRTAKGKNDFCVSVFTDNSGGIIFDTEFLITHKVETHNTPSLLDPFGGAITGIVGVNRDAMGFGRGAKPIANVYGFCVGNPRDERMLYRGKGRAHPILSPERILSGVVAGINSGGNESGIPTPAGFVSVDDRYRGKPLVFAGTVGLIPRKIHGRLMHKKRARPGDLVVMMGGRVGADGIHGATFSSEALHEDSPATAVQIGDPITQKKMSDMLVKEARDKNLYTSITDNGAGGLSCSVAEMAKECGGCEVELARVPLKYTGLAPWEIWISESQERMTLSVPKNKWKTLFALAKKRGVEATVIGKFTASGRVRVFYRRKNVMDMAMRFLHDGRPITRQKSRKPKVKVAARVPARRGNLSQETLALLARPHVGSFAFISSQYDHEVQGSSVTKPLQGRGRVNADAAVIRPVLTSERGAVLTAALAPRYSELDPYRMAAYALDEAVRRAVVAGADPGRIAILDNFCWTEGNAPERLWQLKEAARALYDYAIAYGTPFISGKDSMFNDFRGFDAKGTPVHVAVPPTLLVSALGLMDNVAQATTLDFKQAGDVLYLLGDTHEELGGSEYYASRGISHALPRGARVPATDAKKNLARYRAFAKANARGLIASAISIGAGGFATALLRSAIAGQLGASLILPTHRLSPETAFFSESAGRILVSVRPSRIPTFEKMIKTLSYMKVGTVTDDMYIRVKDGKEKTALSVSVGDATTAYRSFFAGY